MTIIKLRRGTAAQWATANPILADGEPGIETDTRKEKFGNGVSAWNDLAYINDAVTTDASQLTSGLLPEGRLPTRLSPTSLASLFDPNGAATTASSAAQSAAIATAATALANHISATDPHGDRAYTNAQINALVNGAPGLLDTLGELAAQLTADESAAAALTTAVNARLVTANNLSDVPNKATARTNLGLGTAATMTPATIASTIATDTSLTSAFSAKSLTAPPSYAGSRTKPYNGQRSAYNWKADNTRRLRRALGGAGRSDNGNAAGVYNELWIGDSILSGCTGLGLGSGGTDRFDRLNTVAQFHNRVLSARTGIPSAGTGLMKPHEGSRWDARFTVSAGVLSANAASNACFYLPAAGTVSYTTVAASDKVRVTYYDNFTGTGGFKIQVNGATSGTGFLDVVGTGTGLWKTATLTNPTKNGWASASTVLVTGITNSGGMVLGMIEVTTTDGGLTSHNEGGSGSGAYDWANIAGGGGFNQLRIVHESPLMLPYEYDVVHICFGLFDALSSNTTAFAANMLVIKNYFPNSDIILHAMPVPGQFSATPQTWLDFVNVYYNLADSWDVPLIDVQALFGGYSAMNALGLTADTTAHYLQPAYKMWGLALAELTAA